MWIYILIIIIVILFVLFIAYQRSIHYHPVKSPIMTVTPNTNLNKLTYGQTFSMKCAEPVPKIDPKRAEPNHVISFNGEVDNWIRSIAIECSDGTSYDAGLERGMALSQITPQGKYSKLDIYYDKENIDAINFYDQNGKVSTWGRNSRTPIVPASFDEPPLKIVDTDKQTGTNCGTKSIIGLTGTKSINGISQLGVICEN